VENTLQRIRRSNYVFGNLDHKKTRLTKKRAWIGKGRKVSYWRSRGRIDGGTLRNSELRKDSSVCRTSGIAKRKKKGNRAGKRRPTKGPVSETINKKKAGNVGKKSVHQ